MSTKSALKEDALSVQYDCCRCLPVSASNIFGFSTGTRTTETVTGTAPHAGLSVGHAGPFWMPIRPNDPRCAVSSRSPTVERHSDPTPPPSSKGRSNSITACQRPSTDPSKGSLARHPGLT